MWKETIRNALKENTGLFAICILIFCGVAVFSLLFLTLGGFINPKAFQIISALVIIIPFLILFLLNVVFSVS